MPATLVSNANNGLRTSPHARVTLNSRYRLVNRWREKRRRSNLSSSKLEPQSGEGLLRVSMHRRGRGIWSGVTGAVSGSSGRMRSRCHVRVSAFNRRIRGKVLERRPAADNFKLVAKHLLYTLRPANASGRRSIGRMYREMCVGNGRVRGLRDALIARHRDRAATGCSLMCLSADQRGIVGWDRGEAVR